MASGKRTLHYVFKIGNRDLTISFYRKILGMKVLRHEEFEEGCKATCNGPYDGKWSKTMIGYGPEDNHFVCELTYNYGIGQYALGNDFMGLTINSTQAFENCKAMGTEAELLDDGSYAAVAPGGYKFILKNTEAKGDDPVEKVTLASSDLKASVEYWTTIAGMKVFSQTELTALVGYNDEQAKLELKDIGGKVDHQKAFGRIAIACPREELEGIQNAVKARQGKILTELVSLDTPGKATVEVVILADPDDHEICFVGDEAFRQLSQVDPKGDDLLNKAMSADKSSEWFAKRNIKKADG